MLIARVKKETNIVEYIIYMWQIEDIIRSYRFDMELIRRNIVDKFEQPEEVKEEIYAWYLNLVRNMKAEKIEEGGHLAELQEQLDGINILHKTLLTVIQDKPYQILFDEAKPIIHDLMKRSDGSSRHEIEACLNGMYGLLMLRLKGTNISEGTKEGMKHISKMLAHLSVQYNKMRTGELKLPSAMNN